MAQFGRALGLESELLYMDYTQVIGDSVELRCLLAFTERGFQCSIPYGNSAKYDFIVDVNGELLKIQCKSCINPISKSKTTNSSGRDENAIIFSTISQTTNTKKTVRHNYTSEQIDYFATCYQNKVYLVPVEECSSSKTLRFAPPLNGNKNYNRAEDYELDNVFQNNDIVFLKSKEYYEENLNIPEEKETFLCVECKEN